MLSKKTEKQDKNYLILSINRMILAEPIFLSLQWEWPHTWMPSIFVRFYWCNLCCKWCDSRYAVDNPESIINTTVDEVVKEIKKLNCHNIVFTGGEPTLFHKEIQEIQDKLWRENYTWEIETNWSIPVRNKFHQINISPKLSNSWNEPYKLQALNELSLCAVYPISICFKFVAKTKKDCKEIQKYIKENDLRHDWIYIMPEWTDYESQLNTEVLQFCLDNEYRYCQRMHIILFWNKKGV